MYVAPILKSMKLRIDGTFLRSKVARRVFLLFVLSALVPSVLLALLSYGHVHALNQEDAKRQLAQAGASYARGINEQLLGAHLRLGLKAAAIREGRKPRDTGPLASEKIFKRIYHVAGETAVILAGAPSLEPLPRVDAATRAHLASGESALLPDQGRASMRTLMASTIDLTHPERGMLIGELEPDYLWGVKDDEMAGLLQACVLDAAAQVLFCSDEKLRLAAKQFVTAGAGNTGDGLLDTRGLFLRARFGADDWTIVTYRPNSQGGALSTQLSYTFLGVIVFTLLLVALLSVVQIRRTLVPLELLIEGTRRIGREEFNQQVRVDANDEFGQLADAMNGMAARLGQNMETMRALASIDHEILTRVDMTQVIARVQRRLHQLLPKVVTGIVVFDRQAADFGIVHLASGEGGVWGKIPTRLEPWMVHRLARDNDGAWFDAEASNLPDFLTMMAHSGALRILVLPIFWRDRIKGILAIGSADAKGLHDDMVDQARDLGNRIGVALAAQAREEELKYRAYLDDLTGIPIRSLLIESMRRELTQAKRRERADRTN